MITLLIILLSFIIALIMIHNDWLCDGIVDYILPGLLD